MSKYLARLGPGDTVEIRGPHLGFDLGTRSGLVDHDHNNNKHKGTKKKQRRRRRQPQERHVVFLAGGTGIAPAMQAARRLLPPPGQAHNDVDNVNDDVVVSSVQILWANRASADCAGCLRVINSGQQQEQTESRGTWMLQKLFFFFFFFGGPWRRTSSSSSSNSGGESQVSITGNPEEREHPSLIMAQLNHLQEEYARQGRTLEVKCAVDEEGGGGRGARLSARDIAEAVIRTVTTTNPNNNNNTPRQLTKSLLTTTTTTTMTTSTCFYHSQRQLQDSTEDLDATTTTENDKCETRRRSFCCTCDDDDDNDDNSGTTTPKGKNLFIISGPEGFITSFVGPKVWARGAERQGPVGGVVAELMRKDPAVWEDWLVLKQ